MSSNLFAKALAEAGSKDQAEFLNEFFRILGILCKEKATNQLCYIADDLSPAVAYMFKDLYEYYKLSQETRATLVKDIQDLHSEKYKLEQEVSKLKKEPLAINLFEKNDSDIPF